MGYDDYLRELTSHAFRIFSVAYLPCGINIYGSSLFTALNNGGISALISFLRTCAFSVGAVLILPYLIGTEGIWWATPLSEALSFVIVVICILVLGDRYGYKRNRKNRHTA